MQSSQELVSSGWWFCARAHSKNIVLPPTRGDRPTIQQKPKKQHVLGVTRALQLLLNNHWHHADHLVSSTTSLWVSHVPSLLGGQRLLARHHAQEWQDRKHPWTPQKVLARYPCVRLFRTVKVLIPVVFISFHDQHCISFLCALRREALISRCV